jgi:hypothetical protein
VSDDRGMSRLVDTTICPDCRGALGPVGACTVCGLELRGPLAVQLWSVMVTADRLVEQLRSTPAADPAGVARPAALPSYPTPSPAVRPAGPRRLPAASVPVVLLSLGGLCLLVAAIVFVAVTWSLLGLTGRTLVLLGFTSVLAVAAVVLTRRSLRGAAETFWLVVAGMLAVDLLAAQSAGLAGLDALTWRGTGALVGGALLAMGTGVALWSRRQSVGRLLGAEGVTVIGGALLCASNAWLAENPAVGTTVAVPLLVTLFVLLRPLLPVTAYGLGGLGVASWAVLLGLGWDRSLQIGSLSAWWYDVRGWPLLAAAALAAAVVHLPGVPGRVRPVVAGLALFPLVLLAGAPQTMGTPTRDRLVDCGILVLLALVTALAPGAWARGAAVLTVLGALLLGLVLAIAPWDVLWYVDTDGRADAALPLLAPADTVASWTWAVSALAVVAAAGCLLFHVSAEMRGAATLSIGTLGAGVLSLGGLALVLGLQPPLWTGVLAGLLATTVTGVVAWWGRDHPVASSVGSGATAYLSFLTLYAASASHLLTALTATILALALVAACVLRERVAALTSAAMTACLSALLGGWALVGWGHVMEADPAAQVVALAVYAGLVGVLASPATRQAATRISLEASGTGLALLAAVAAPDEGTVAMVLTIAGTAVCVVAVSARDRSLCGWAGAAVLAVAILVRVGADVHAPELYTLPAAALLVAAGAWQLRRDPGTSSLTMLGSGLTLALLPSLLLALDEPVSLRGVLVGAAGVLVLAVGVQLRLAAPFVLGAATTGLLAVRHLGPVADAVPRWISLGGVGLLLLVVGVTWESRRRDLETAQRYLTALR